MKINAITKCSSILSRASRRRWHCVASYTAYLISHCLIHCGGQLWSLFVCESLLNKISPGIRIEQVALSLGHVDRIRNFFPISEGGLTQLSEAKLIFFFTKSKICDLITQPHNCFTVIVVDFWKILFKLKPSLLNNY